MTRLTKSEWLDALIEAYGNAGDDPNEVRALAWTNKRVHELNHFIREELTAGELEPYCNGERLMAKEPIFISETRQYWNQEEQCYRKKEFPKIFMHSCAECTVERVKQGNADLFAESIDVYYLDICSDMGNYATVPLIAYGSDAHGKTKELMSEFKKKLLAEKSSEKRKSMWRQWYGILERLNLVAKGNDLLPRLQYAYAITVHQSQGGTFKKVFVDAGNIFGCRNTVQRNQLFYVAFTRASEHLTVLSRF